VGCARAVADEARHAEICLEIAYALGCPPIRFAPIDVRAGLGPDAFDPLTIATSLVAEGCIAETIAARLAAEAADAASGTDLEPRLREIAADEAEHAMLAWRALGWLLSEEHDGVRDAVSRVFLAASEHVGIGSPLPLGIDAALHHRHGILSDVERLSFAAATLQAVVLPAASVLLGWRETTSASFAAGRWAATQVVAGSPQGAPT
jgi:hypothetical protein